MTVFAAASTTDAVEDVDREFARLHPEVKVRESFAASSTLAQQIAAGAAADVFLSASTQWSEFLEKKNLVARQQDLLSNELVIVVPVDSQLDIKSPADLAADRVRRVALADAAAVPAGIYARQALTKLGLWKSIEPKATGAADVRQALAFVETAAAEAGIVYATDAAASRRVRVVAKIDPLLTEPIRYPLALTARGAKHPSAVAYFRFLAGEKAAAIFRKHGFVVLTSGEQPAPSR